MAIFASYLFALLAAALPACEQEDSTDCVWDASEVGNGIGNDVARITVSDGAELWLVVRPDGTASLTLELVR